jgi:ribose transport system permease protein
MNKKDLAEKMSRPALVLIIGITLSFLTPDFLTINNIMNVLRQSSLILIMALGMLFVMLLGRGLDLSIGAILALTSCWSAMIMSRYVDNPFMVVIGILVGVLVGLLIGAINGALVAYFSLPAMLVTYGTRQIIRGIAYIQMSDKVVTLMPKSITFIGTGRFLGISMPIWIAFALTLIVMLVLKKIPFGRRFYLVGANPKAAFFSGIDSKKTIIFGFMLNALFSTLAGLIYIGRLNAAEPQIGADFHFTAISCCAIGGVSMNGGTGSPLGVVCGALILMLLQNGMNLLGISANWNALVQGVAIIIAVLLDYLANRKANKT